MGTIALLWLSQNPTENFLLWVTGENSLREDFWRCFGLVDGKMVEGYCTDESGISYGAWGSLLKIDEADSELKEVGH